MEKDKTCIETEISEMVNDILIDFSRREYLLFKFDIREVDIWDDAEMDTIQKSISLKTKNKNDIEFKMLDKLCELLRISEFKFNIFEQYSEEGRSYEIVWFVKKE